MNTRSATLFASPVDWNFYGYRIVDNNTARKAENVTASFKYRGYEVAMTSHEPAGSKVILLLNKVLVDEFGTVEAAIEAVDEMMQWRGASAIMDRDISPARRRHR